jgi:hypothetical protein
MSIQYHIYAGDSAGGPVDYTAPIATVSGTTYVDARARIVTDAGGVDVTGRPNPPTGLTARATAGGTAALAWTYNPLGQPSAPTGFHVYRGVGAVDYTTPVATVAYSPGLRSYRATISGLTHGTDYLIGVRAYNAAAEEPNAVTVGVTGDTTGPDAVDDLGATVV